MNVWTFLALVSVGASMVAAYFSLRLAQEPRSRFGYTALRCVSPDKARSLYKRAQAVLLPGAILSTLISITGLVVSNFGSWSAVWTLGSLILLGVSMLVGWFLTKKGSASAA